MKLSSAKGGPNLILASTSKYRKALLNSLGVEFEALAPNLDEEEAKTRYRDPMALVQGLAYEKANSVKAKSSDVVIGSDQALVFEGRVFGKPGGKQKALETLQALQGQKHELLTAVCILKGPQKIAFVDVSTLTMKRLSEAQILRYIERDKPYDCAGSYKIEGHGMSLFKSIETKDASAIQGLPLLKVAETLENLGFEIP